MNEQEQQPSPPLSDEQLQQIRKRLDYFRAIGTTTSPRVDAESLLAEVERLRAIEAARRETIAYAEQLERVDVAMLGIIQDLAAEVPDWHDAVRLNGEAVTFLAERAGETLNKRREELDAQNAAMRKLVQFVAGCDIGPSSRRLLMWQYDDADVYVTKARAILAAESEATQ